MSQLLAQAEFNQQLLNFLQASPTPFHATQTIAEYLSAAGFVELDEAAAWDLETGKRYFIKRNDSSIIAFVYGKKELLDTGIRMLGAHTDSPCLKVKPQPELNRKGYMQLGVEVYGGALLAPWFDRDLSLAGRVTYKTTDNKIASALIDFKLPVVIVPSLAIHLDREVNNSRSINAQRDIVPVLLQFAQEQTLSPNFKSILLAQLKQQSPHITASQILDFEISLYDTQAPALVGLQQDFIASARLDNLLSCFVGLQAILQANDDVSSLLICTDHEEVGSTSCCGAKGPMLQQFLERLIPDTETRIRVIEHSLMISADNAHGVHPNFMDRHDENHGPLLNRGPVIKINANQRYATTSETSGFFHWLCEQQQVPVQVFVARTDMGCGSTIGPIVSSEVGVKTIDVGVPTFAMHSIRELAGVADAHYLYQAATAFYQYPEAIRFV
ncbi:putative M18 family aminopeptidase 2 [Cellvibrio zantedeschiae]|uniref:M18 family aminopeptidase n=1 Tax=Cellvibrio zantedeschiae TaxID=1237077 RepID=A0ABQ3AW67_9GAMM|nr:M18 family aminopeptidase [Cellvibrio zantedeschiae]GGY67135.1 putative M18 family aminopeptidase 2 [Cellvibrio zantedeschiae]